MHDSQRETSWRLGHSSSVQVPPLMAVGQYATMVNGSGRESGVLSSMVSGITHCGATRKSQALDMTKSTVNAYGHTRIRTWRLPEV